MTTIEPGTTVAIDGKTLDRAAFQPLYPDEMPLLEKIRTGIGEVDGRGFIDSAPVLERSWAVRSGLGWVGRNGNLLNRQMGSFFFIATLIVDLDLEYDTMKSGW